MKKMVSVLSLVALVAGSAGIAAAAPGSHGGAGGFHGGSGGFHGSSGFRGHPGFHRGFHGRAFIGGPVFVAPFPYYYAAPPAYVDPTPYGYWYYCPSAGAYYPTVGSCPEPWVPVPASGG
jgi:hypothetical protein